METTSPNYEQLMRMWVDFASKMAAVGTAGMSEATPTDASRKMRDMYLRTLSEHTEQFMRSPQFLEMMKQSTDMAVAVRQQANDFLAQAHQAAGSVSRSDVDSLLMAIRRSETRVLDRLDELSARLDQLEKRMASEPASGKASRKAK